jgi:hypothetical protein
MKKFLSTTIKTIAKWFALLVYGVETKPEEDPYDPKKCLEKLRGKSVDEQIFYLFEKSKEPTNKFHYIFEAFHELSAYHHIFEGEKRFQRNFLNCRGCAAHSLRIKLDNSYNLVIAVEFYKPAGDGRSTSLSGLERTELALSAKATKEIAHACQKINNLYERFGNDVLVNIELVPLNEKNEPFYEGEVQSIGLGIRYKLLDEDRYFTAYYKSNMFKKKLNGAAITADNLSCEYSAVINKINQIWRDNGSNLRLQGDLVDPTKTTLNDMPFITTLKSRCEMIKDLCSEEFFKAMINLLNHDVYLVRISDQESQLVMDPKVNSEGFIEFKPVFKMDTTVLAVSIAATKLNTRLSHESIRC